MFSFKSKDFLLKLAIVLTTVFITIITPLHLYREAKFRNIPVNAYTGTHQWLTASAVKFCNIYFQYGARHLNFMMYEEPFFIENSYRPNAYVSYPPGTLLPLYAAAKIMKKTLMQPLFVKNFIMSIYYLMTLLFAAWTVVLLHFAGAGKLFTIAGSVAAAAIFAYLSPNYYYLRHVFFSDQMILPYVLLFLMLEYFDHTGRAGKKTWLIRLLQMCVVFAGCFTDYFFCMLIAMAVLVRMFSFPLKPFKSYLARLAGSCFQYAGGALIAFGLFSVQLYFNVPGAVQILKNRFLQRSYNTMESFSHLQLHFLWERFHYLHPFAVFLLAVSIVLTIYFFLRSFRKKWDPDSEALIKTFTILLWSSLIHTFVFFQHSWVHEFSVLKYCLVLVMLAMLVLYFSCKHFCVPNRQTTSNDLFYAAAAAAVLFTPFTLPEKAFRDYVVRNYETINMDVAKFILRHAEKNDVLFSFTWRIPQNPPFEISISQKRLYALRDMNDFPMDKITPGMKVCFVLTPGELQRPDIKEILPYAEAKIEENGIILLRYKPSVLMEKSYACYCNYHIFQTAPLPFKGTGRIEFRLNKNIFNTTLKRSNKPPQRYNDFFIHVYQKNSAEPIYVNNFSIDLSHVNNFTGRSHNTVIIPPQIFARGSYIKIGQFIPEKRRLWEYDIPVNNSSPRKDFPELNLKYHEK